MSEPNSLMMNIAQSVIEYIEDEFEHLSLIQKLEVAKNIASCYENKLFVRAIGQSLINTIESSK